ncbi:MAG: type I restriction enzyme endonuclease domain-containing protein [Bacillota bacterium]
MAPAEFTRFLQRAHNAVVADDDETKSRFLKACTELTKAFALVSPHPEAARVRATVKRLLRRMALLSLVSSGNRG